MFGSVGMEVHHGKPSEPFVSILEVQGIRRVGDLLPVVVSGCPAESGHDSSDLPQGVGVEHGLPDVDGEGGDGGGVHLEVVLPGLVLRNLRDEIPMDWPACSV